MSKQNIKSIKKIKTVTIFCLFVITIFSLFFIPVTNFYAWRAVSIIEFQTLRIVSLLLKDTLNNSAGSTYNLASHRGSFSKTVAENSKKSIVLAANKGFLYIELDVTFTKDHIPIIFHDLGLNRKTNVNRLVSEVTWAEIQQIKLFDGQEILSLNKLMSEYSQLFDAIILDIKTDGNYIKERAASFVEVVNESQYSKEIYVIGLNCNFLSIIKSIDMRLKVGCENQGVFYNYLNDNKLISLNYNTQFSFIEHLLADKFDMTLILWTINNKKDLEELKYLKNSFILTDLHNVN